MQQHAPVVYGKYQLLELLARGGMAEVFKAKSHGVEGFEKVLVIKRILPELSSNPDFVEMFINEAKIAVTLSHANVVQVFDLGRADETYFIAMEYVAGSDLATVLRRARKYGKPLPLELAVYLISEVAKGLDYAHRRRDADLQPLNIVHRDVSPQNVLISYEGEVKLTDFGIAKARGSVEEGTAAGVLKGKYAYMAPEQARGRTVDARTDLFALGVVLYECLAGRSPFLASSTYETLQRVREGEAPPLSEVVPSVPEELSAIVARAMSPDSAQRHEDAGRFYEDLVQFLYGTGRRVGAHDLSNYLDQLRALSEGRKKKAGPTSTDSGLRRAFDMETRAGRAQNPSELTPAEVPSARHSTGASQLASSVRREAPRAERRDVTVLALGAAAKPPALELLIERMGGQVVHSAGDVRFVLFGLVQPDGRDTETAARLALHLPETFPDVGFRVGVHAGRVVVQADGTLRENEAYRKLLAQATDLVAQAKEGRALVSPAAARASRRFFELLEVEEGLHELVAERDLAEAYGRFVGRRAELRKVGEALASAARGKQTLVSIVGEPGSGKTRLILETMRRVRLGQNDVGMIVTRVPANGKDVPLSGCQALLREVVGVGDLESSAEIAEKVARLRELGLSKTEMDAVSKALGVDTSEEEGSAQRPLRAAIARIAMKLAEDRLTVFAFDDLEGMDAESLQLLRRLARNPNGGRLVIVVAHRGDAPFDWEGFPNHVAVRLGPLPDEDIAHLVAVRLGVDEVPGELLREIVIKSSGNPLYVEEYLLALQEAGAIRIEDGKAHYEPAEGVEVPRSLRGIVAGRLARLGDEERGLLRIGAVIGGRFHVAMVATVAQLPRERVAELLEGLVEREILIQTGAEEMGFAHQLVPEIVHSQLPLDDRRALHERVAQGFETVYPEHLDELAERLAHHYREAGKRERAIDFLVRAADRLENEFALAGAVGTLARAIEMIAQAPSPDRERELKLHERIAALCLRGRELMTGLERIEPALELAEGLGRDEYVARFSLDKGLLLTASNRFAEAEPWFDRARQVAKNAGHVELLGEIARGDAEAWARNGDNERAAKLLEEALQLAKASGDVDAQRRALVPLALAYGGKGDLDAARQALEHARETLGDTPERIVECDLWKTDSLVSFLTGNLQRTLDSGYRALDLAKEYGFAYEAAVNAHNIGETLIRMGDFKRAFAMLRYSYDLSREHGFLKLQYNNMRVLGYIDAVKLGTSQGRDRVVEALQHAEEHGYVWDIIQSVYTLALVDCVLGDQASARAGFQRLLRLGNEHGHAHYAAAAETALAAMDTGNPVPMAH